MLLFDVQETSEITKNPEWKKWSDTTSKARVGDVVASETAGGSVGELREMWNLKMRTSDSIRDISVQGVLISLISVVFLPSRN